MNTAELIATVRRNATIEDVDPDYTDAVLLKELQDSLTTKFQRMILDARSGYWLQYADFALTTGTWHARIPARSIGISKVTLGQGAVNDASFVRLPRIQESHADIFEVSRAQLGQPRTWVTRGDKIVLLPTADNGSYTLRVWYYVRPSRLVTAQSSGATDRGRVLSVDTVARAVTVNQIPWDQDTSTSIVSGVDLIDVVRSNGWHEHALVGSTQTWSGSVITVGGSADLSEVQVGDYVRAADQSEWPPLPVDYHRCLADICSVKVLVQQDFPQKATTLASDVVADMERFSSLISDRVKEEPRKIRAELPFLRRRM